MSPSFCFICALDTLAGIDTDRPTLICAAHGTASVAGLATLRSITAAVQAARPELRVVQAFLDVAEPSLASVLATFSGPAVVVPVLLSGGYHVHSDIPSLLAGRHEIIATPALGPDSALASALADLLVSARAGRPAADRVILVSAGSSDPSAQRDVVVAASYLAVLLGRPVSVAVLSGEGDSIADVRLRFSSESLEVASYLLAEGLFASKAARQAAEAGIETVTGPIGAHPAVIDLVVARYELAVAGGPG